MIWIGLKHRLGWPLTVRETILLSIHLGGGYHVPPRWLETGNDRLRRTLRRMRDAGEIVHVSGGQRGAWECWRRA